MSRPPAVPSALEPSISRPVAPSTNHRCVHAGNTQNTKHKTNPNLPSNVALWNPYLDFRARMRVGFFLIRTVVSEIMPLPSVLPVVDVHTIDIERHTDQRSERNIRFNYEVRIVSEGIVAGYKLAMASNVQHRLRGPPVARVRRAQISPLIRNRMSAELQYTPGTKETHCNVGPDSIPLQCCLGSIPPGTSLVVPSVVASNERETSICVRNKGDALQRWPGFNANPTLSR
ncbi:hypothetical protein C8R45DRAFT_923858 [Mycena sanguinolenta]|nr:hypothetical protein C8R45DRAFT_923858 [Mycena sanguinolenta]